MSQHHQQSSNSELNFGDDPNAVHPPGILPFSRYPIPTTFSTAIIRPTTTIQPSFIFPLNRSSSSTAATTTHIGFGIGLGLALSPQLRENNPRNTTSSNIFGSYVSSPTSFQPAQRSVRSLMSRERESCFDRDFNENNCSYDDKVKRLEEENSRLRHEIEALSNQVVSQDMDLEWYYENTERLEKEVRESRQAQAEKELELVRKSAQISALHGSSVFELTVIPPPIGVQPYNPATNTMNVYGATGGHDPEAMQRNEEMLEQFQILQGGDPNDYVLHEIIPELINLDSSSPRESIRTATIEDVNRLRAKFGDL